VKRLVLASNNPGKLKEIRTLLLPLAVDVVAQADLGIDEAEEPHDTFLENALAKARHASTASGLPALADDSGLCVDALGGEPGVRSAYYAGREGGREARDARNNTRLLEALHGVADRRAHYYCVLVLLRSANDPQPIVAEGTWHGEIARAPRGAGGFGYDPLFLVPGTGRTAAELAAEEKNRVSHRGRALAALVARLGNEDRA
jgi:XTP/dITP diphosphohydrolase